MDDRLIFRPDDVDLARSPLRRKLQAPTHVLGAFNPGLTRLANGNLLLMVRVAEALSEPVADGKVHAIRWAGGGYRLDAHPLGLVALTDPRQFDVGGGPYRTLGLTSLSWLLPVELDRGGERIVTIHYDKAIEPAADYQQYGVEDPRISRIGDRWYMTTCSVSAERHSTTLYTSSDALHWDLAGIVLDHQNKDMCLFEGLVGGRFAALTRPLGELYFACPPDGPFTSGPSINLAWSPDALHWKPEDRPLLRPRKTMTAAAKLGGGTPPVLTPQGWLMLYHGVETRATIGVYRTFWALLDPADPVRVLRQEPAPVLEGLSALTEEIAEQRYLPNEVVFTTGIVAADGDWLVASGEADLACRMTRIPRQRFA